jgi:hypothetical protein
MSKQRAQCCKCHATIFVDEECETQGVMCDECWEDEQTNMDPNDPDYYDYMSYSDADEGL